MTTFYMMVRLLKFSCTIIFDSKIVSTDTQMLSLSSHKSLFFWRSMNTKTDIINTKNFLIQSTNIRKIDECFPYIKFVKITEMKEFKDDEKKMRLFCKRMASLPWFTISVLLDICFARIIHICSWGIVWKCFSLNWYLWDMNLV